MQRRSNCLSAHLERQSRQYTSSAASTAAETYHVRSMAQIPWHCRRELTSGTTPYKSAARQTARPSHKQLHNAA